MLKKQKILVIEDDNHILQLIKLCLSQEGFEITTADNGEVGLNLAERATYDLIILDIMLPGKNGWEICRQLTGGKKTWVPILMLTAKGSENDRILGLEMGADDYVVKPFSPRELVARVRAILRRRNQGVSGFSHTKEHLEFPGIIINSSQYIVKVNDNFLILTPKEFELLYFLAQSSGQVFSREQLLTQIWGYQYAETTRTVDEHIKNLRRKITAQEKDYKYIHTVWGVGYKFEVSK
ncbi:MAG: DNA-binding response regulator [Firmicutes bacterium HGW-Firmicutes-12]|nr:MAG: DNA-binding response regulator [Firmicutes bacterium HGW-Firmicutes-12]